MTTAQFLALLLYPLGVAVSQIMLKAAANRVPEQGFAFGNLFDPVLIAALTMFGGLTVWWILIVRDIPLTRAYPFVALSFALTPVLAVLIFRERVGLSYVAGAALIILGVVLTQRGATE